MTRPDRCPHCGASLDAPSVAEQPQEKEPHEAALETFGVACKENRDTDATFRDMWAARAEYFAQQGNLEAAASARRWAEQGRPSK